MKKYMDMPKVKRDYSIEHITNEVLLQIQALKDPDADYTETVREVIKELSERVVPNQNNEPYIGHRLISCVYKKQYSLEEARETSKQYKQSYYHCHYCGQYHLTKQATYESIMDEGE